MKDWINQVYTKVCVQTGANITSDTMTLTAGAFSYTLPSAIHEIKGMFVTPTNGVQYGPLQPVTLDEIIRRRQAAGGTSQPYGQVSHYALLGMTEFELWPTPQGADVLTVYYSALPTPLSAGTDVPILPEPYASKLIEFGALMEAADFVKDPFGYLAYAGEYDQWLQDFRAYLNRKGPRANAFEVPPYRRYPPHDPSVDAIGFY